MSTLWMFSGTEIGPEWRDSSSKLFCYFSGVVYPRETNPKQSWLSVFWKRKKTKNKQKKKKEKKVEILEKRSLTSERGSESDDHAHFPSPLQIIVNEHENI